MFRYIWLNALREPIHEALAADDGNLGVLATKATKMLRERTARQGRSDQVNAVGGSEEVLLEGEVDAVMTGKVSKSMTGAVCANHLRFPGNCYRCFDPERCLLKDAIIQRPPGSGNPLRKAGNARADLQ